MLLYFHAQWNRPSQDLLPAVAAIDSVHADLRGGTPEAVLADSVTAERLRSWVEERM